MNGISRLISPSRSAYINNVEIEEIVKQHQNSCRQLVILGLPKSGVSTIFRQFCYIYGCPISIDSIADAVKCLLVVSMAQLLEQLEKLKNQGVLDEKQDIQVDPSVTRQFSERYDSEGASMIIDSAVGNWLETLWRDPVIQIVYQHRREFGMNEGVGWYFERLEQYLQNDFDMNEQDAIMLPMKEKYFLREIIEVYVSLYTSHADVETTKWVDG